MIIAQNKISLDTFKSQSLDKEAFLDSVKAVSLIGLNEGVTVYQVV